MTAKPAAVVVRLNCDKSDPQWEKAYAAVVGYEETKKAALWDFIQIAKAIGAPVTGWDMPVITTIGTLRDPVPCVRQSDALTKLAEKDVEIFRLRAALDEIEIGIDALPDELECGDRMTAREMQRQALIIVKEEMKALKGPEA